MNRRSILKFVAALPIIGLLVPRKAIAEDSSADLDSKHPKEVGHVVYPETPEEMAQLLIANLKKKRDRETMGQFERGELVISPLTRWMAEEDICRAMCTYLNDWTLSDPFCEGEKRPESPRFAVMPTPISLASPTEGDTRVLIAEARKVKASWSSMPAESATPLTGIAQAAFLGIDVEAEVSRVIAWQLAIEVQMEIRKHAREGRLVKIYAFHLPPYMGPSLLSPEDFSIRRSMIVKYAKVF